VNQEGHAADMEDMRTAYNFLVNDNCSRVASYALTVQHY